MPIVEEVLWEHIDSVAGIHQLDEELPIFGGGVAVGLVAADRLKIGRTIDRIGISVDVLNAAHDVGAARRPVGVAKLPSRDVCGTPEGQTITRQRRDVRATVGSPRQSARPSGGRDVVGVHAYEVLSLRFFRCPDSASRPPRRWLGLRSGTADRAAAALRRHGSRRHPWTRH